MKSPIAAPAFTSTTDESLAAALSVLGIEIIPDKSVDSVTGKGWSKMLLGLESVPWKEIGAKLTKEEEEAEAARLPSHNTKTVLGLIRNGMLQKGEPHHPALDVIRACRAADALVEWISDGKDRTLVKVKGADRYMLKEQPLDITVKTGPGALSTGDLKLAATLVVLGCQPLRIEGTAPNSRIIFGPVGFGTPPVIPTDLRVAFRNGTLAEMEPEHPMLWMMQGLSNRDAIRDMMHHRAPIILMRAPGTGRASLVSQNASGRTLERAARHLRIKV